MELLKYLINLNRKFLRVSFIISLGFCLNFQSFSNPILIPPMILEVYFSSDDVYIELLISEYYGGENLDNIRMTGLYDTAQFLPGIMYTPGEVFYVTREDFETPFNINQAGDYLNLEENYGGSWYPIDYYGLPFGDIPGYYYCAVSAPTGEESIACQMFTTPFGDADFWTVKELPNSIGSSPYNVQKRAAFSGYVKDKNDEPLGNIKLYYCLEEFHYTTPGVPEIFTDENGYFFTDNMFCKNYFITFFYNDGAIGDTIINVEPDSANYFEFRLDTLLTGTNEVKPEVPAYSICNVPNPFSNQTKFVVETTGEIQDHKGIIKIYSNEGYIVDILPVEINGEKQDLSYNPADKSLASGIYYYSLEVGHEKKASGKMVISR
jgi:hypothetical protein